MQHRTLALALSLFGMSCSPAAKPPEPAHPAATSAPTAVSSSSVAVASSEPTALAATAAPAAAPAPPAGGKVKGAPSAAPGAAVVDSMEPLAGGTLTQADVRKIIEKSGDLFGDCYTLGAGSKTKEFIATVRVKATIGPSGAVNAAQVVSSTAKNPKVDTCVAQAFKKIKFPAPKNGGTSVITFPIQFNGLELVP